MILKTIPMYHGCFSRWAPLNRAGKASCGWKGRVGLRREGLGYGGGEKGGAGIQWQ